MYCTHEGCNHAASTALAVQLWPMNVVIAKCGNHGPLGMCIVSAPWCEAHVPQDIGQLVRPERFASMVRTVETASGFMVDLENVKLVRVPLDDPDFVALYRTARDLDLAEITADAAISKAAS